MNSETKWTIEGAPVGIYVSNNASAFSVNWNENDRPPWINDDVFINDIGGGLWRAYVYLDHMVDGNYFEGLIANGSSREGVLEAMAEALAEVQALPKTETLSIDRVVAWFGSSEPTEDISHGGTD